MKTDLLAEQYAAARSARDMCAEKEADACYGNLLRQDPGNWEPVFFTAYYEAKKHRFEDTKEAAAELSAAFEKSLGLLCGAFESDSVGARKAFHVLMRYFNAYIDSFVAACVSGYLYPEGAGVRFEKKECLQKLESMLTLLAKAKAYMENMSDTSRALIGAEELRTVYLPELYIKTVEIGTRYLNFAAEGSGPLKLRRSGNSLMLKMIDENTALIRETEPSYCPPYCKVREALSPEGGKKTFLLAAIVAAFCLCIAAIFFFLFMREP